MIKLDPIRKFTLTDALVLVAAVAGGMATVKAWGPPERIFPNMNSMALFAFFSVLMYGVCVAAMITIALVVLRLRQPRPPIRFVVHQPGLMACAVAAIAFAFRFLEFKLGLNHGNHVALETNFRGGWLEYPWIHKSWKMIFQYSALKIFVGGPDSGLAVIIAWLTMFAADCWRAEPSWIDRLGRFLGIFWICMIPFGWLLLIVL